MPNSQFWCFDKPKSTGLGADWTPDMDCETIRCPITDGHQRAGRRLSDLKVVLPPHGPVEDVVWMQWGRECLLQDHVLKLLKDAGFTGFDVKPVTAEFKRTGRECPKLWELVVTGWAGMASAEAGIQLVQKCDGCGLIRYSGTNSPSALIDESQWDGSDFFVIWPLPMFIFVTDRVANLIREYQLTGVVLVQPSDLHLSSVIGPERLSYYMPEQRARELGAALGID